jgi:hypothetical protein
MKLTAGSPEWRDALGHVIDLLRARHGDQEAYSAQLRQEMQRIVDANDPLQEAALAADAAITLAYQLALTLQLALADYGQTAVELDQILEWARGKLDMHSGLEQAEQGGLDELLNPDE